MTPPTSTPERDQEPTRGRISYRDLFGTTGAAPVVVAGALTKLPLQMYPFAVLLLVERQFQSYAAAGVVAAAAGVGLACVNPMHGRLLDRFGNTVPLRWAATLNLIGFAALLAASATRMPLVVVGGCAVLVALTLPPVTVAQRALWQSMLPDPRVRRLALSVDAQVLDAAMVAGPLVVTAIVVASHPLVAIAAAGVLLQAGTWWFTSLPASRAREGSGVLRRGVFGPLRAPGLRPLLLVAAMTGGILGAVRVGLVAYSGDLGAPEGAGLALAAFGVGSVLGGTAYGVYSRSVGSTSHLRVLTLIYAIGTIWIIAAPSTTWLPILCAMGGAGMGPVMTCTFELVGRTSPTGLIAESYAWVITATFIGAAIANAITGVVAGGLGGRAALAVATGFGLLSFAAALVSHRYRPTSASPER